MYLNKLNNDEKVAFLELARYVASANGVVEDAEKEMIAQYCAEMGIVDIPNKNTSIETIISTFSDSSNIIKNIVMIELIGLCMSDGEFDSDERVIIEKISSELGVSKEMVNDLENDLKDYFVVVTKMTKRIFS